MGPLHCSYLGQAKSIVSCYLTMVEKVVEKRSCYCEETLKEAVWLVNVEGFSFATGDRNTTIVQKRKPGRATILTEEEECCLVQWTVN